MNRQEVNELIAALAEEYPPNASGWVRLHCPFCEERGYRSTTKNLAINPDTGAYVCWRKFHCGTAGNFLPESSVSLDYTFAKPELGGAYSEVFEWLRQHEEADEFGDEPPPPLPIDLEGYIPLDPKKPGRGVPYLLYLRGRGVSMQTVVEAKLGYAVEGPYRNCVIIPILKHGSYTGQAVYRDIRERNGRTTTNKNTVGYDRRFLLNGDALEVESSEPVAIVEGEFDALPHWPHAVPVSGKPSDAQLGLLAQARRPIVLMLDGDARVSTITMTTRLRVRGANVRAAFPPPGKDPGDLSHEDFLTLLRGYDVQADPEVHPTR